MEGTNEINRIVIANTLIRRGSGTLDLMSSYNQVFDKIEKFDPVSFDDPKGLNDQIKLFNIIKKIRYVNGGESLRDLSKNLRDEQELMSMIINILIEIMPWRVFFLDHVRY